MSIINSILKAFVGDKSEKDVKAIQPLITKIKSFESSLSSLSHDELRAKTTSFKEKIKQARSDKDAKIASLKAEVEKIVDIDKREEVYTSIENLKANQKCDALIQTAKVAIHPLVHPSHVQGAPSQKAA